MKQIYFALLLLCAMLVAVPAQAQQEPPVPKIMALPAFQSGNELDEYTEKVFWGLRDATPEETQVLADQLTARLKWIDKQSDDMEKGIRTMDKKLYDQYMKETQNWIYFYLKVGERFHQNFCRINLKHNDKGQWYIEEAFPEITTGHWVAGVPESQVGVNGHSLENKGTLISLNNGKKPFRFGYILSNDPAPSELIPIIVTGEELEVAKRDRNLAWNVAVLFAGYPVQVFTPGSDYYERFRLYQQLSFFYLQAFDEAMANNTPDKMTFKPMPKAGGMHASMKAKVLAVEKSVSKDVVDVVITSDSWQIDRNAAGQPVRRVIFGYSIVNTPNGKMATRVSWAEDHQGGGQYGALHAYGNGMASFYVK